MSYLCRNGGSGGREGGKPRAETELYGCPQQGGEGKKGVQ